MKKKIFKYDYEKQKSKRQKENYQRCLDSGFKESTNYEELDKILAYLEMSKEQLLKSNPKIRRLVAYACATKTTRQSTKDETAVIKGIDSTFSNINFRKPKPEIRPTKDGRILSKKEMLKEGLDKDKDALKSFDIEITGAKVNGYGFHKYTNGKGGHQDNVRREVLEFIDWANKNNDQYKIYILILDGIYHKNCSEYIEKAEWNNILIGNHIEIQEMIHDYIN